MHINELTRSLQQPLIERQSLSQLDELRHGQTELSLSHPETVERMGLQPPPHADLSNLCVTHCITQ